MIEPGQWAGMRAKLLATPPIELYAAVLKTVRAHGKYGAILGPRNTHQRRQEPGVASRSLDDVVAPGPTSQLSEADRPGEDQLTPSGFHVLWKYFLEEDRLDLVTKGTEGIGEREICEGGATANDTAVVRDEEDSQRHRSDYR